MKFLILTFQAGEGHNSAARAVLEQMQQEGHEGEIVDFLGLLSDKLSKVINDGYVTLVKRAPFLYGFGYRFSDGTSGIFRNGFRSPLYLDSAIVSKRLRDYLDTHGPYDGIVATHLMPSQALAHLKKHNYPLPTTVSVVTDYTWYPYWQEIAACDYCVVPNESLIDLYVQKGIPREMLRPYGIPVSRRFSALPTRAEARAQLGFSDDEKLFLVMGGSMGAGNMRRFVKRLFKYKGDAQMVVICGKNEQLKASLEKKFFGKRGIRIVGFTTDVPVYMMACDVLYTKPGGLSTSEALICRIPMVHTAPIPGQETDNMKFFAKKGCSFGSKRMSLQLYYGLRLMSSEELRAQMRAEQAKCAKPHAARDIVRLVAGEEGDVFMGKTF
ncbi:MAG: glycosyl transferase [Clostridia bacterium]|nr:glycosyl transferase [Clostridia bacterium]